MRTLARLLTWIAVGLLWAGSTYATTWHVDPDGGGLQTVQDALIVAASGDTILLSPGSHDLGPNGLQIDGQVHVSAVTIIGAGLLPDDTTMFSRDPNGSPGDVISLSRTNADMTIERVTITDSSFVAASHGVGASGGGVVLRDCVIDGTHVTDGISIGNGSGQVLDCRITVPGEAIRAEGRGHVRVVRSELRGGVGVVVSGTAELDSTDIMATEAGIHIQGEGVVNLRDSRIHDCDGSAVKTDLGGRVAIERCLVDNNGPTSEDGIIVLPSGSSVRSSTVVQNVVSFSGDPWRSAIHVAGESMNVVLAANIVAFNDAVGVRSLSHDVESECNLLWANGVADQLGLGSIAPSNSIDDPLFCDPGTGDFTVDASSPAADGPCGQIGAFGVGCGGPVATPTSAAGPELLRVAPNPFNPTTTLTIDLERMRSITDVRVYDARGGVVRSLVSSPASASQQIQWDGRDDRGRPIASGVYFIECPATPRFPH